MKEWRKNEAKTLSMSFLGFHLLLREIKHELVRNGLHKQNSGPKL